MVKKLMTLIFIFPLQNFLKLFIDIYVNGKR